MHTKGEQGSSASQRMASFMPDDLRSSRNPALVHAIYASHCIHHTYFLINAKNCGTCGLRTWILLYSQRRPSVNCFAARPRRWSHTGSPYSVWMQSALWISSREQSNGMHRDRRGNAGASTPAG